ncbi:MAG: SDR family oxidoreductase [Chloroflexota bacterium]|nr:SDR family oxidoreductase [Chloroflexota bacterium]
MSDVMEKFSLDGRTALVTGGVGLLGKQFTRALGQAGAKVVVADLDQASAQEHAKALISEGIGAHAVQVDVTNPGSVSEMVHNAVSEFGGLDVLVNSAALDPKFDPENVEAQSSNAFETYPLASWKQAIDVNLTGMFLACQAASRQMLSQEDGVIINICSTYGLVGPDQRLYERPEGPRQYKPVYYTVSKAGVLGLTRYLATYYAGKNIRVNALTPGGVYNQHDDTFLKAYSARTVMGRMANLDEMDGAIVFLASEASSYMTGANLVVDGGWTAW